MSIRQRRGQVVVEYVLLMIITASIAALLVKGLASRNPDNPGVLLSKWCQLLEAIAQDEPEDVKGAIKKKKSACP